MLRQVSSIEYQYVCVYVHNSALKQTLNFLRKCGIFKKLTIKEIYIHMYNKILEAY